MLEISKKELKYLASEGLKWGSDLHGTVHHRHYYMTETWQNKKLLKNYRQNNTVIIGENSRH